MTVLTGAAAAVSAGAVLTGADAVAAAGTAVAATAAVVFAVLETAIMTGVASPRIEIIAVPASAIATTPTAATQLYLARVRVSILSCSCA